MPRIILDFNESTDLETINGVWNVGAGFVPGDPNDSSACNCYVFGRSLRKLP